MCVCVCVDTLKPHTHKQTVKTINNDDDDDDSTKYQTKTLMMMVDFWRNKISVEKNMFSIRLGLFFFGLSSDDDIDMCVVDVSFSSN